MERVFGLWGGIIGVGVGVVIIVREVERRGKIMNGIGIVGVGKEVCWDREKEFVFGLENRWSGMGDFVDRREGELIGGGVDIEV